MTLQTSGAISLNDIQNELGGENPIYISEYYGAAPTIPESGIIRFSDFYGISFGPAFTSLHTLDNPNPYGTSENDYFARSVGISGTYCIVGAGQEDDAGGTRSGKAYIFDNATGTLLRTLNNPNAYGTSAYDSFGYSVAISDTYCIVGANSEGDKGGTASGKAYIYANATGALLHTLHNPNRYGTSKSDYFGISVGISDKYCIVGAGQEDDASGSDSGKAYIFDTATGKLLHTLDNPNAYGTSAYDWFSYSVAISDTYAIVGAIYEDDAGGEQSGKAYIYDNATGTLLHILDNPNAYGNSSNDYFGSSVGISNTYAIVGARYEEDAGGTYSGKAYIYDNATGTLLHTLDNPNAYSTSAYDYFGQSVGISDTYCIVGANGEDDDAGNYSGKAYIFDNATGTLLHTLDNTNAYGTSDGDYFGYSVAISGTYAIVGANSEGDASGLSSGKAYIFNNI